MKKHINMILSFLFASLSAFASESRLITIEGDVRSFDKDVVKVSTPKGVVSIPRKFIPPKVKLKLNGPIKIPLSEAQLAEIK